MSKFEEWLADKHLGSMELEFAKSAWNARGKVDSEIAYETLDDPYLSGHGYATNVKEAIEQENERG